MFHRYEEGGLSPVMDTNDIKRRQYSETFKREIVDRFHSSGMPVVAFARAVGIEQSILHRWVKKYDRNESDAGNDARSAIPASAGEVAAMRKEITSLRQSVAILREVVERAFRVRYAESGQVPPDGVDEASCIETIVHENSGRD